MTPIFLIVGPPAVGKSTTSRALAARFTKSLHIPVDNLRDLVVSGYALPGAQWSEEMTEQLTLARTSAVSMALTYHSAGFAVVIDDFWNFNYSSDYQALLAPQPACENQPPVCKIVLFPAQAEAHQRNFMRSGESPAREYIDEGIRLVYERLNQAAPQLAQEGWSLVDSTRLSIDETVTLILERSAR